MWQTAHSTPTDLPVAQLWRTFEDIHCGRLVLPEGDTFAPEGPLAVGTRIVVTPAGQDPMTSVITEFEPQARYADETVFDGLTLTFRHLFAPTGNGTRITHELTIDGDAADEVGPELGPQISGDFAGQMDALIAAARAR